MSSPTSPPHAPLSPKTPFVPLSPASAAHFDRMAVRVRTAVRIRPPSTAEIANNIPSVIVVNDNLNCVEVIPICSNPTASSKISSKRYVFDTSFGIEATQAQVYAKIGRPLVQCAMHGLNASLFAYGQTGTGKTHSIVGTNTSGKRGRDFGLVPRLGRDIMEAAEHGRSFSEDSRDTYSLSVSLIEIYNEKVFDLLSAPFQGIPSRVREHPELGVYVENLTREPIPNYIDYDRIVESGLNRRKVADTLMNSQSSRSHTVFTVYVEKSSKNSEGGTLEQSSKICLVDLAGSETIAKSGLSNMRVKEASYINRSLSTLCDVIQALSKRSAQTNSNGFEVKALPVEFIPYRNSVLTWLLKDIISGNCMTTILATVGPTIATVKESERTLRYIQRAKMITNSVHVNEKYSAKDTDRMNKLLSAMKMITEKFDKLVHEQKHHDRHYLSQIHELKESLRLELIDDIGLVAQRAGAGEGGLHLPKSGQVSPILQVEMESQEGVEQSESQSIIERRRGKPMAAIGLSLRLNEELGPPELRPGLSPPRDLPPRSPMRGPTGLQLPLPLGPIDWGEGCELSMDASLGAADLPDPGAPPPLGNRNVRRTKSELSMTTKHKRASSDNTLGVLSSISLAGISRDPAEDAGLPGETSPSRHRRSRSNDRISNHSGAVLTAIDVLSKRAQALRRQHQQAQHTLISRKKTMSGSVPGGTIGIAMPDHSFLGRGLRPVIGSSSVEESEDYDEISDIHSLDSYINNISISGSPRGDSRSVDEIICEYENTIMELQNLITFAMSEEGTVMDSNRSVSSTDSYHYDPSYAPHVAVLDSLGYSDLMSREQTPVDPLLVSTSSDSETIEALRAMLRERDSEVEALNKTLLDREKNYSKVLIGKEHEIIAQQRLVHSLEEELSFFRSSRSAAEKASQTPGSASSVDSRRLVDTPTLTLGEEDLPKGSHQDDPLNIFTSDDYEDEGQLASVQPRVWVPALGSFGRSPLITTAQSTPRLAMEDIDMASPRQLSVAEVESYHRVEILELQQRLKHSVSSFRSNLGAVAPPAWVAMDTLMSYICRLLCEVVRSGKCMNFTEVRELLSAAGECDIVEVFREVRPLIAELFKTAVQRCEEIVGVWSRLEKYINGDYDSADLLKELIAAKIQLAENDVELTKLRASVRDMDKSRSAISEALEFGLSIFS